MAIWSNELSELNKLYSSFRGGLPDIVREMEQLLRTEDANVVMLYARRCLEVIITDLCESELNRPRKTEPLKGIIDKLNSEEKVPAHIITSMISLNSMANYGAHPKDFDPEQVKPVLNNLAIIIKWYLKYKDFKIVSKTEPTELVNEPLPPIQVKERKPINPIYGLILRWTGIVILFLMVGGLIIPQIILYFLNGTGNNETNIYDPNKTYFTDGRDNEVYTEITIGDQVWMGENLRAVKFNDGTTIPLIKDDKEWQEATSPAYSFYNHKRKVSGSTYGVLYNWFTVNTGKLCPVGWHVPSSDEWNTLITFLGDSISWVYSGDSVILVPQVAGKKLKEAGIDHWVYCDTIYSTDTYGFRALPGGYRSVYGWFVGLGEQGFWWSSTEDEWNKGDGKNVEMFFNDNGLTEIQQYKQFGMSVRCLKDKPPGIE